MYGIISLLSHIWFPVLITLTPALNKLLLISGVMPYPPATFSAFAITKLILY